jgi:nitroreductase
VELREAIKERRAIWDYGDKPVPREHTRQIIEVATWAPAGFNKQPAAEQVFVINGCRV